jgi:hypothetical protein
MLHQVPVNFDKWQAHHCGAAAKTRHFVATLRLMKDVIHFSS